MGCGASHTPTAIAAVGKSKEKIGASTQSGSTAQYIVNQTELSEGEEPLTEEQLKLIREIDARTDCSTANSASEPGELTNKVRVGIRVAKARLLYGVDGSCDEGTLKKDSGAPGHSSSHSGPYGELNPRQIRRIQDWITRMDHVNSGRFSPVPERYINEANIIRRLSFGERMERSIEEAQTPTRIARTPMSLAGDGSSIFSPLSTNRATLSVSEWNELPGAVE